MSSPAQARLSHVHTLGEILLQLVLFALSIATVTDLIVSHSVVVEEKHISLSRRQTHLWVTSTTSMIMSILLLLRLLARSFYFISVCLHDKGIVSILGRQQANRRRATSHSGIDCMMLLALSILFFITKSILADSLQMTQSIDLEERLPFGFLLPFSAFLLLVTTMHNYKKANKHFDEDDLP